MIHRKAYCINVIQHDLLRRLVPVVCPPFRPVSKVLKSVIDSMFTDSAHAATPRRPRL
jgi:hypothetical protein